MGMFMHEIRVTIPSSHMTEAIHLAHAVGIDAFTITDVRTEAGNRQILSVETSTPKARRFTNAVLISKTLSNLSYTLTSREVRAIISHATPESLTRPMSEPFPDVIQDLWQLSHVTSSYVGRAAAGGILLAMGIIENNAISILAAALFLPFLAQLLALSFGLWSRDLRLFIHGARAVCGSILVGVVAGAGTALALGGPIQFSGFRSPLSSFVVSAIIGATAGLSNADDTGRRYLIGVAAAVQLAIFPVWFGAALVLEPMEITFGYARIMTFLINLITIGTSAVIAYMALHSRTDGWRAFSSGKQPR
jgi:hypothetical protein